MPTGYTYPIEEKNVGFKEFILGCARAFGACVSMREMDDNIPIPEFVPSPYHLDALEKAEKELVRVRQISIEDADKEATIEYESLAKSNKENRAKAIEIDARYGKMLLQVLAWTPPTPDHKGLKDFMIQQIEASTEHSMVDFYSRPENMPTKLTGKEWIDHQIDSIVRNINYHSEEYKKEVKRIKENNKWVNELKDSLKEIKA